MAQPCMAFAVDVWMHRFLQKDPNLKIGCKTVTADGTSFFRALAYLLYGKEDSHADVRKRLVAQLESKRKYYEPILKSYYKLHKRQDFHFRSYDRVMKLGDSDADDIIPLVASEAYQAVVCVLRADDPGAQVFTHPDLVVNSDTIFLHLWQEDGHYNAVLYQHGQERYCGGQAVARAEQPPTPLPAAIAVPDEQPPALAAPRAAPAPLEEPVPLPAVARRDRRAHARRMRALRAETERGQRLFMKESDWIVRHGFVEPAKKEHSGRARARSCDHIRMKDPRFQASCRLCRAQAIRAAIRPWSSRTLRMSRMCEKGLCSHWLRGECKSGQTCKFCHCYPGGFA